MAHQPVFIYSHRIDVPGLISVLRSLAEEVRVVGPEDNWSELIVLGPKKWLRPRAQLVVHHKAEYYEGNGWRPHLREMQGFFGRFPDVPWKDDLMQVIRSFRFCLSLADAELDLQDDERLPWVYAICRHLDGVLMTPAFLLNADGQMLIGGIEDPEEDVRLPAIPPMDDHPDAEPDEQEYWNENVEPPSAERVAKRAMVLAAIAERGMIENEYSSRRKAEKARAKLQQWLEAVQATDEIEPEEWESLQRPFGRMDPQDMTDAVWRIEGLGVLLWALSRFELPRYDTLVEPHEIWEAVEIYEPEAARQIIERAQLRPSEEIDAYRIHATMANWRFRNWRLHPEPVDFLEMSRNCWIGSFDVTRFEMIGKDVAVDGMPIAEAPRGKLKLCESIADERHRASNWLIGWNNASYQLTDTST